MSASARALKEILTAKPVTKVAKEADKVAEAPTEMDLFEKMLEASIERTKKDHDARVQQYVEEIVPPPRKSVEREPSPLVELFHTIEEGENFKKVGIDQYNYVDMDKTPEGYKISMTEFSDRAYRGKGLAVELYAKLADEALAEGKYLMSDSLVSAHAQKVWEALERRGYILERNPYAKKYDITEGILEGEEPALKTRDHTSVYKIVGKQTEPVADE